MSAARRPAAPMGAIFAALALFAPARAEQGGLAGGVWGEGLILGVDPATRTVSGYYSSETGGGQFSCIFYLTGKLAGARAAITTWFPQTPTDEVIKGELARQAGGTIRVRLASEHGGCWNVQPFADKDRPAEFTLETARPWTSVAVVKSKKAYFFATPTSATHRKGYVVQGDGLGVRAERPGWLAVDFVDPDGKAASGWIRRSDVYPNP
ncbi:MAG TPA: hypothetical protein VG166_04150 [Caulobacteraceae bacterium]|nr:hypothetical protein [Caulobacteraceae bacterium]